MKKITNLLFMMMLLFCSCSQNDNEDESVPLVPSLTGAITENEVNFDNPNLKCTNCIIEIQPATRLSSEERYASMKLQFNDNVEIIINSIADIRDVKESDKVYRLLKCCIKNEEFNASITVNLKNGDKIVSSETFTPPANSDWWSMASDNSYFTIDLTLKGKRYTYKGMFKYVFPDEPVINTGAITDKGVDFNNKNLKCIKYTFQTLSETENGQGEKPTALTLLFNDDVEIVIKGLLNNRNTEYEKVYFLLKNCYKNDWNDGSITINLKNGDKVVSSETFDPPTDSDWWSMAENDYFTINLDLKGKQYTYKGQIKYVF